MTKSIQRQRRSLVPPGVTRVKHFDFPSLDAPLEPGMVAPIQGCLECTVKNIHCTYGAGVRLNGKTRDPADGKCDYCLFTTRKCRGNGFVGYKSEQFGAHTELVKLLNRLKAQVDTCSRAGEEDRSRAPNRKALVSKIERVREKLARLSTSLKQGQAKKGGAGSALTSAIVIE